MAGRGRGGKTGSFTQEQLQTLGVGKDMPQVQTAPPPTYPPLMSKPIKLETTADQNYQILWKEDFLNNMRDSPYFLQQLSSTKFNKTLIRHGQKNTNEPLIKLKGKPEFNWSLMPAELQMSNRKRTKEVQKPNLAETKKTKSTNIEDRLKQLEEKEKTEKDVEKPNKANSDSEHEPEEEGEVVDDEMDEENDYGMDYFDNGESYNDEDDNLDDGPVY